MYHMRKSEEPLVVCRFPTWLLYTSPCSSSATLLAAHTPRIITQLLQRLYQYHPTESNQQEDLATLGSVQLRQTWAH